MEPQLEHLITLESVTLSESDVTALWHIVRDLWILDNRLRRPSKLKASQRGAERRFEEIIVDLQQLVLQIQIQHGYTEPKEVVQ